MTKKYYKWGLLLSCLLLTWQLNLAVAQAAPLSVPTSRIAGANRIATAIAVSQKGWPQSGTVLLARADDYPDSLVATPLSRKLNAPILLTNPSSLDSSVLTEIKRLGANKVVILGGQGVLGAAITNALDSAHITWERVGGNDRYATAVAVAEKLQSSGGKIILTSGQNFPDALAVGSYAAVMQMPILLTASSYVPSSTRSELTKLQAGNAAVQTLVIGGEGVIKSSSLSGVPNITRLGGSDRFETAAKVYLYAQDKLTGMPAGAQSGQSLGYVVTGSNFPDSLAAGALAAKQNAPLFLTSTNYLPAVTYSVMGNAAENNLYVYIVGGTGVVSDQVKAVIQGSLQPPYLLSGMTIVVDPGHGGPDPGAIGASGTPEKVYNLAIGLDLAGYLRAAGATVIMTRSTDVSPAGSNYSSSSAVPDLQARVDIAEKYNANLFICIHNNSATPLAHGTETYYSTADPVANQSSRLAQDVQSEVVKQIGLTDRGVKQADYYVLKNTTMPAILVEVGFITNWTEEKLIASTDFQNKAAFGIYRGVLVYKGY